ncbi:aminoglycoside 3'-phosphotransferase [Nocardioides sp. KIGAM211]|uniref:Aminoglycoside 3'-phosphotransferase n=1 Tax=Nocardioides luti TaxID=2761101 RepID=A0A7X0RJX9_9ACTN|nr:aminoglycoside 3'-phosphotransferase [Nocardioides luti]MBB6628655.1 aminoglycoside 3'-phosphotransferase [Nocardioides luti]
MDPWTLVETGCTDTVVRRSPDGTRHAKTAATPTTQRELADERDRLLWLATTPVPAAEVLDWSDDGTTATLTTATVPGVPASDLGRGDAEAATASLVGLLVTLHALPIRDCPFDRRLGTTLPLAAAAVAAGEVDEDDLDEERAGRTAEDLLEELTSAAWRARDEEFLDLAVCHGDACLPNVLVDPDTLQVTGIVDVGRLGVADRHLDLALLSRSMAAPHLNPGYGVVLADRMLAAYPTEVDPWRLDFYRLLDEFF